MTPPGEGLTRRKTDSLVDDPQDDEILRLIRESTDASEKAMLTALFQVNRNSWRTSQVLTELVEQMQEHSESLEAQKKEFMVHRGEFIAHMHEEAVLFSKGIGAWRAISIVGIAVISLGSYILSGHLGDMKELQTANAAQGKTITDLTHRMDLMDKAFSSHYIQGVNPHSQATVQHGLKLPER